MEIIIIVEAKPNVLKKLVRHTTKVATRVMPTES